MKKIHYTDYFSARLEFREIPREIVEAIMKQKGTMKYYPKDDVLYVMLQAGEEAKSVEIEPGVTAELNKGGELIGIEILDASVYLRKLIQDRLEPRLRHRLAS
jgi:uncharacterized protein YuzE